MWVIRDVQCVLTPPLSPSQYPQSVAKEEVWREVRLSDHLPQHGEEQWWAADPRSHLLSVGVHSISGLALPTLVADLPGLKFITSWGWTS